MGILGGLPGIGLMTALSRVEDGQGVTPWCQEQRSLEQHAGARPLGDGTLLLLGDGWNIPWNQQHWLYSCC